MNYLLCSEGFLEKEGAVWFSSFFHNGLYRFDKASGGIKLVKKFQGEKGMAFRLYGNAAESGKSMVFVPLAAKSIAIYTPETNELKMLPLPEKAGTYKLDQDRNMKFWTSAVYGNRVFMFGWDYPVILELDMAAETFCCHTGWMDELNAEIAEGKKRCFGAGVIDGKYAYLPLQSGCRLMRFNLETAEHEWMKVETDNRGFAGVSYDGRDMWLVPCEGRDVIKWSPESGVKKILKIPCLSPGEIGISFYAPLIGKNGIYLFPAGMKDVYFIDTVRNSIDRHERLSDILTAGGGLSGGGLAVLNPMAFGDSLFFVNCRDFSWHLYNEKTGKDRSGFLEADEEIRTYINRQFFDDMLEKRNYIRETGDFSLEGLLAFMKQGLSL